MCKLDVNISEKQKSYTIIINNKDINDLKNSI